MNQLSLNKFYSLGKNWAWHQKAKWQSTKSLLLYVNDEFGLRVEDMN